MPTLIPDGYVVDTCALIDLFRRYPANTFGRLWNKLEQIAREGRMVCPGQVLVELRRKDDEAAKWLEDRRGLIVRREGADVWGEAQRIANANPGLVNPSRIGPQADPFVIALAKRLHWIVLTSERTKGFGAVNIPSVCKREAVRCLDLLQFFTREGWQL